MTRQRSRSSSRDARAEERSRQSASRARVSGQSHDPARSKRRHGPQLFNIVSIRLRTNFIKHDCDAQELLLRPGDQVIVESPRGPVIATVEAHVHRRLLPPEHELMRVLRKANSEDLDIAERNEGREEIAYRFALDRVRARRLPMKLMRAQLLHDSSKVIFYFSAEGRIDFRDLVKDLAHRFRTRIEMHQIGVRDGARMLGGIGPCGRELCCSTFLESFAPVSIRMAKDQGLTLNPKKVSGMCGRLMCCLVYEQHVYKRLRRRLPRHGAMVFTEAGEGRVIGLDVVNERVTVELEDTNRRTFAARDVSTSQHPGAELMVDADPDYEPDYLWDELLSGMDDESSALARSLDDEPEHFVEAEEPAREALPKRNTATPGGRSGRGGSGRAKRTRGARGGEPAAAGSGTSGAPSEGGTRDASSPAGSAATPRRRSRGRGADREAREARGSAPGAAAGESSTTETSSSQQQSPQRERGTARRGRSKERGAKGNAPPAGETPRGGDAAHPPAATPDNADASGRRRRRRRQPNKRGGGGGGSGNNEKT